MAAPASHTLKMFPLRPVSRRWRKSWGLRTAVTQGACCSCTHSVPLRSPPQLPPIPRLPEISSRAERVRPYVTAYAIMQATGRDNRCDKQPRHQRRPAFTIALLGRLMLLRLFAHPLTYLLAAVDDNHSFSACTCNNPGCEAIDQPISKGIHHGYQVRLRKVPQGGPLPLLPDLGAQRRHEVSLRPYCLSVLPMSFLPSFLQALLPRKNEKKKHETDTREREREK